MKNRVWMKSALRVVVALAISAALTVGVSAGHSAVASNQPVASEVAVTDEATPQATPVPDPPSFQTVWQCFTPNDAPVGLPKSPQSACLAACPAPNHCQACSFNRGAVDCG